MAGMVTGTRPGGIAQDQASCSRSEVWIRLVVDQAYWSSLLTAQTKLPARKTTCARSAESACGVPRHDASTSKLRAVATLRRIRRFSGVGSVRFRGGSPAQLVCRFTVFQMRVLLL